MPERLVRSKTVEEEFVTDIDDDEDEDAEGCNDDEKPARKSARKQDEDAEPLHEEDEDVEDYEQVGAED